MAPPMRQYGLLKAQLENAPRRKLAFLGGAAATAVLLLLHLLSSFGGGRPSIARGLYIEPLASFRQIGKSLRRDTWPETSDFDLVVAHYDEDPGMMEASLKTVLSYLPSTATKRIIIYEKGGSGQKGREALMEMADEVIELPNVGREGETYLNHISRNYHRADTGLAEHTLFMQPHLAWDWIFIPRLEHLISPSTGFISFGPYINQTCGTDSSGQIHPRMADIYSMFRGDFCPPTTVLATWAGQFMVSKKRILQNQFRVYENLREKFHEPEGHWIWEEGWWNNEPSNPTLGHALERTWPVIFDCINPTPAQVCHDKHIGGTACQCLD